MVLSTNRLCLILLFLFESVILYSQFADQIAAYYPLGFDQLSYLIQTYRLVADFYAGGWLAIPAQVGSAPTGVTFPIQGALLGLIGGANKTAFISLNVLYFVALQIVVFFTVLRTTGQSFVAWIAISMVLAMGSVFHFVGGVFDYRIDFAAMCLYGIWACALVLSDFFDNRRWSVIAGLIAALLVSMRFITLAYVGPVIFLLFLAIVIRQLRRRGTISPQMINALLCGVIVIVLTLPLVYAARKAIFAYYGVGHLLGGEKNIRAAEVGITSLAQHLLFYPENILAVQLRRTCLAIGFGAAIFSWLFGTDRLNALGARATNLAILSVTILLPVAVLTFDVAKSEVVAGIVSVPLVLFLAQLIAPLERRDVRVGLSGICVAVGVMAFIFDANRPQHYLTKPDLATVDRLNNAMVDYIVDSRLSNPRVAFDQVNDFLNSSTLTLKTIQRLDRRLPNTAIDIAPTMGNIFAISEDAAMDAVKSSDLSVVTDQYKGRETPYPFNDSMKQLWPKLAAYSSENFYEIASGTIRDIPYRIYARPKVAISGLSGGWITSDGIELSVKRRFLQRMPIIVLTGAGRNDWLKGKVEVTARSGSVDLPASMTFENGAYRISVDARSGAAADGTMNISLAFNRYFIPKELGINQDTRKLVMSEPLTNTLETPLSADK